MTSRQQCGAAGIPCGAPGTAVAIAPHAGLPGSRQDRQPPEAKSLVFDDNDRSGREFLRAIGDHPKKPWIYGGGSLISQSKNDDARTLAPCGRENVPEIQVEREHNSALGYSFCCDLGIGKTDEAFVAEMDCVMIGRPQRYQGS